MSSITRWSDKETGIEVWWEKGGRFVVFAPTHRSGDRVEGTVTQYRNEASAIRAAKRKAKMMVKDAAPKRLSELIGKF